MKWWEASQRRWLAGLKGEPANLVGQAVKINNNSNMTKEHRDDIAEARREGYIDGYATCKKGFKSPSPKIDTDLIKLREEVYGDGYCEGFKSGYDKAEKEIHARYMPKSPIQTSTAYDLGYRNGFRAGIEEENQIQIRGNHFDQLSPAEDEINEDEVEPRMSCFLEAPSIIMKREFSYKWNLHNVQYTKDDINKLSIRQQWELIANIGFMSTRDNGSSVNGSAPCCYIVDWSSAEYELYVAFIRAYPRARLLSGKFKGFNKQDISTFTLKCSDLVILHEVSRSILLDYMYRCGLRFREADSKLRHTHVATSSTDVDKRIWHITCNPLDGDAHTCIDISITTFKRMGGGRSYYEEHVYGDDLAKRFKEYKLTGQVTAYSYYNRWVTEAKQGTYKETRVISAADNIPVFVDLWV